MPPGVGGRIPKRKSHGIRPVKQSTILFGLDEDQSLLGAAPNPSQKDIAPAAIKSIALTMKRWDLLMLNRSLMATLAPPMSKHG